MPDLRYLISDAVTSVQRHPDPRLQWDPAKVSEVMHNANEFMRPEDRLPDAEIRRQVAALAAGGDDATGGAWSMAQAAAQSYLSQGENAGLTTMVARLGLAVAHAERWTTQCIPAGDSYVIAIDTGLMGAFHRVARYLAFYWRWNIDKPERVYPQTTLFKPYVIERIFRVYFSALRWNGYFMFTNLVNEPASGKHLGRVVKHIAIVFALLHEIAHAVDFTLRADRDGPRIDDESRADELAARMIAQLALDEEFGPISPGLVAVGVRHYFQTLRAIEGAIYMIRPTTHPSAEQREGAALKVLLDTVGPTGAYSWSRVVYRPVEALITLAGATPPVIALRPPFDLPDVFTAVRTVFPANEINPIFLKAVGYAEALDSMAHLPPEFLAATLWSEVGSGNGRYSEAHLSAGLSSGNSPSGRQDDISSRAAQGWAWLDSFVKDLDEQHAHPPRLTSDGLRYAEAYWIPQFHALDPFIRCAAWSLHATRLGWDSRWKQGIRNWGQLPGGTEPRAMTDLAWVIRDEDPPAAPGSSTRS
jgi:hypothetical protein